MWRGGRKTQTNLWGAAVVRDSLFKGLALLDLLQEISVHDEGGKFRATETERKKMGKGKKNETRSVTPFVQKRNDNEELCRSRPEPLEKNAIVTIGVTVKACQ